ncbi:hypothetical protein GCM10009535_33140 [Streptomyces thermocarboxydovorans]|uniref:Uncharacterized protein n=1 Tax=Streptomyces thermocarboxydovorans TaxID=59298 RepID=A0ABN1HII9_9ACTN
MRELSHEPVEIAQSAGPRRHDHVLTLQVPERMHQSIHIANGKKIDKWQLAQVDR